MSNITVYSTAATQSGTYDGLNQQTNLSGRALTWDANGNLLSDGLRNYGWDAENRLAPIIYAQDKQSDFAYERRPLPAGMEKIDARRSPVGQSTHVTPRLLREKNNMRSMHYTTPCRA